ncbi:uncharacterized protein LOC111046607 [Nilaparvata lugens]|uniref:uncharacterized protein LOC111046607 n=1 Tax=Nilaparvata lugens TaxID=108931 RepID=UPI000B9871A8|nr:uncharacterized protein LOC111046607 [Nilaparvata lugens]
MKLTLVLLQTLLTAVHVFALVWEDEELINSIDDQTPELAHCLPNAVCSVVHRRFWLPPITQKFCECKGNEECSMRYQLTLDSKTMQLDSRSQLQFCEPITSLPVCEHGQPALDVKMRTMEGSRSGQTVKEVTAIAACTCHWPTYWALHRHYYTNYFNGTTLAHDYYTCAPLKKCNVDDFCGNLRADIFSAYYQCSCPAGTLCINNDRSKQYAAELFYQGPIYRAKCQYLKNQQT